ncbi:AbrB/MazE/SpoVT family DNA-binding domain-containing protein [Leptolyngbya sp. 7M]|uniref:AbrB/MazE/SpoVT family DNA-binding domain-containing protein n=1 Tax=Leptolyngbya sp. 7M TaxID=2812896 RepID=UPI001B8CFC6E|nr:AbrB/MazE/SpoVT family DNA-binding domain-containing protein [Leptolyngbya sp. 7M]QYO66944.1 AbrB/MazE/SpoVT family DNA-binding domain-containing protein [Leptolyngbya sp. 7M]
MKVTSKGQVTIPIELREKFGILPNSEVEFGYSGNKITIRKVSPKKGELSRGQRIVARALANKGTAEPRLTTDEIMALTRGWGEDDFDR